MKRPPFIRDPVVKDYVRSLAIVYAAFQEALVKKDWHGISHWSTKLSENQLVVGVELLSEDVLEALRVQAEHKLWEKAQDWQDLIGGE